MKTLDPCNAGHTVSAGSNAVVTMESNLLSDACAAVYSHDSLFTTYETKVLRRAKRKTAEMNDYNLLTGAFIYLSCSEHQPLLEAGFYF